MGGNGDDKLYGGSGDDLLRGDGGNDILQGGAGNDTFWFYNPSLDDGADVIKDFTAGQDKIRLSGDYDDISIFENQNATWLYSPAHGNTDAWYLMIENTTYEEVVESLFVYEGGQDIPYFDAIG